MSTVSERQIVYQLILEGPKSNHPEALRNLRATMVSELSLGSDQAKFFLEHTPVAIKESLSEEELLPQLKTLQACGAHALIARSVIIQKREKKLAELAGSLKEGTLSFQEGSNDASGPKDLKASPPFSTLDSNTQASRSKPINRKPTSSWSRYREWIHQKDTKFRKMLNEEMIVGTLISCFLTILVCGILIPLELYTRTRHWDNERRIRGFLNTYADVIFYGHLPKIK